MRAAHHARRQVPGLQLHIVGEGYERPLVESVIDELDAADWVTLRGRLSDDELVELYRQAWIVASASAREGWGMTLTEAAACGTPAVATRIAGHADAVRDGESGLLADGDPVSLGDAMARVLGDYDLQSRSAGARWSGRPAPGTTPPRSSCGWCGQVSRRQRPAMSPRRPLGRSRPAGGRVAIVAARPRGRQPAATGGAGSPEQPDRPPAGALALVAYVPLLLTQRGWVSADTKTYLYLDPAKLLAGLVHEDPTVGFGTVTHRTSAPVADGAFCGCSTSSASRTGRPSAWWGTIIFGAGPASCTWSHARLERTGVPATFVYALTPYLLTLVARLSAILLPYVALPWWWRSPCGRPTGVALPGGVRIVVATCGSVNATALLLVGVAPVLWLAHAVWVAARSAAHRDRRAAHRGADVPVSAWWIAGLSVQGTNGIEILRYTETAETVAKVSVSHEVLRGLGSWFFYGTDRLGPWIEPSVDYTQVLPLIAVTYLIPFLGLAGGVVARWRHRAYFVLLVAVGVALAVGAYPWENGPPWPMLLKAFLLSDVGLSMRSLPRAVPLVVLGLAVLLGAGVTSVARRWPRTALPLAVGIPVLAVAALPPLWLGRFVPENLRRPEEVPEYWREAAAHLDAGDHGTRVLVVPGTDFASYRWGNTVDPIRPTSSTVRRSSAS